MIATSAEMSHSFVSKNAFSRLNLYQPKSATSLTKLGYITLEQNRKQFPQCIYFGLRNDTKLIVRIHYESLGNNRKAFVQTNKNKRSQVDGNSLLTHCMIALWHISTRDYIAP